MTDYSLNTKKNFLETRRDIAEQMRLWGISDFLVEQKGNAAKVTYMKNGKTVDLFMDKQETAKDNLRVLYLAIQALRLNELRGIGEIMASAYLQLEGPVGVRDPYEVLGIRPDASIGIAEIVYKQLAKEFHPDGIHPDATKFKEVQAAIEEIRSRT